MKKIKTYVHKNVHNSQIHNSYKQKKPVCPSTGKWLGKLLCSPTTETKSVTRGAHDSHVQNTAESQKRSLRPSLDHSDVWLY